jgi:hypothetical protein
MGILSDAQLISSPTRSFQFRLKLYRKRPTAAPFISRWPARLFFFRKNIASGLEKRQKHLAYE